MSSSALSEADVEGPAVAGLAGFTGFKKEDMEEGPAVEPSASDVEGPAVARTAFLTGSKNEKMEDCLVFLVFSSDFLINLDTFLCHEPLCYSWQDLGHIPSGFPELFQYHRHIL
ncbi:hypothetical protein E2C01_102612 [Portunus trituberculatus]|uniref:Uncharacterized protein n=1 Tax=Portunus trituberculatus TaxID=210409 RepID=A0A5B7KIR6_PORTR|nr:hypothetical protein [Portunus trituberculatus]